MKNRCKTLQDYVKKSSDLEFIRANVADIEQKIDALDKDIEVSEAHGMDDSVLNTLCLKRNALDLERIKSQLTANLIEKQLLEFELHRAKAK